MFNCGLWPFLSVLPSAFARMVMGLHCGLWPFLSVLP